MSVHRERRVLSSEELEARALELGREFASAKRERPKYQGAVPIRLGREWYCLPVMLAQEVVRRPALTPVPFTPKIVAGVINLRGEILGAIDPCALLGLERSAEAGAFAVVARHEGMDAAFLADDVGDVVWLSVEEKEPVVSTVPAQIAQFLEGVYRVGERLIAAVRVEKVLNQPELRRLRET